jgi:hypothetical protein
VVGLNAFYQAADFIKVIAGVDDLLFPLLGSGRLLYKGKPFITEGIKASLTVNLTF